MRSSTIVALLAGVAPAFSKPTQQRQRRDPQLADLFGGLVGGGNAAGAQTITSSLGMVKSSIDSLDTAVNAINSPDPNQLAPLATMSQMVGTTIQQATSNINAVDGQVREKNSSGPKPPANSAADNTAQIGLTDALQVSGSASDLTDSLNTLSTDLIAKKPIIDQTGLSPVVAMMLQQQQQSSTGLTSAISAKLPAIAQGQADQQGQAVSAALAKVVNAYSQGSTASGAAPAAGASATAVASTMKKREAIYPAIDNAAA